MGIRYRRSVKLAPGIRMNLSGGGLSWTLGPRGASVGIGKRGSYFSTGIPGTGLYSRTRIGGSGKSSRGRTSTLANFDYRTGVRDDGTVFFQDADGNPLPDYLVNKIKKQKGDAIRDLIIKKCTEINVQIEALGEIHLYTPDPNIKPRYQPQEFPEHPPTKPVSKGPGLLGEWG